jgi:hypothetical protein
LGVDPILAAILGAFWCLFHVRNEATVGPRRISFRESSPARRKSKQRLASVRQDENYTVYIGLRPPEEIDMANTATILTILAIVWPITIALFLIFRRIVCWYWKINRGIELLEESVAWRCYGGSKTLRTAPRSTALTGTQPS